MNRNTTFLLLALVLNGSITAVEILGINYPKLMEFNSIWDYRGWLIATAIMGLLYGFSIAIERISARRSSQNAP